MRYFGLVFGTQPEQPKALEVNIDTVYVRNNINPVKAKEEHEVDGWEYEETQYTLKEFQELVGKDTNGLKNDVADVGDLTSGLLTDSISLGDMIGELTILNADLMKRIAKLEQQLNGGNL